MGTWNLVIGTLLLRRVSMAVQQGARICPLHPLSTLCSPPSTDGFRVEIVAAVGSSASFGRGDRRLTVRHWG